MKCIIVEDDALSIAALKKCMGRDTSCELIGEFNNGSDALKFLNENACELIFLDMELGDMTGLELIQQLSKVPHVIVISSKAKFAAEAFNFDVADYIVKPVNFDRFLRAVSKVKKFSESFSSFEKDFFYVKQQSRFLQVYYKEVVYIEALADYVNIHTDKKRYTILSTMKAIESQLPPQDFMRVHRSFIVRLDKIREIEDNTIAVDGKLIPVSRYSKEDFLKKINLL